jgi:hypothetical protein
MVALPRIQRHLQAIYALEGLPSVEEFLIGDEGLRRMVEVGLVDPALQKTDEQVLVMDGEEPSDILVAVYLSDAVQQAFATASPTLQDHCHATEAVSHFVMLLWSAREGRQVRMLDLELQAEVDKVTTALLLDRGLTGGAGARALIKRLFDCTLLADRLDEGERERYREAHRLVRSYAPQLQDLLERGVDVLLAELRELYRLPADGKLHRLARAA